MASRIVKQPNGKLARFSEVVDSFTHCNLDQEEAICVCKNDGLSISAATAKVQRGIDDRDPYDNTKIGTGLDRWNESLRTIEEQHGKDELIRILSIIDSSTTQTIL